MTEELTETLLTAIRELVRITLAVVDLTGKPIEDVISRVLQLDSAQSMFMTALQRTLPTEEETHCHQAVQCTTCLNPGHSSLDCTMRTHCALCHSWAHTIEQCEYNLLNWQATLVRHLEPRDDR